MMLMQNKGQILTISEIVKETFLAQHSCNLLFITSEKIGLLMGTLITPLFVLSNLTWYI